MKRRPVPEDSLLSLYAADPTCYADCFSVPHRKPVDLSGFIYGFYTSRVFRAERFILQMALGRRISDTEVRALASGEITRFLVWDVEARNEYEILLRDTMGRTRSWLRVEATARGCELWFGSAVTPGAGSQIGALVRLTFPAHRLYSKRLLRAAARRL